ncbi:glycosyltransferase family 2 protein [Paenibacillus peoriae]|uniref:glycosyltransferase family 2 protein n=1 Tax=Paenibacillus peoriae TaxID=59893 RepID=UPI00026C5DEF|nr:glycosyltransferase family 2 protein [Paenibacillus peoriae]MEC0183461.1 glycosyltransferase family 2 protein [Paenibacillus peoriae]
METKIPFLSVVIPMYNESSHLERSLTVIDGVLSVVTPRYELIIVDDGSKDDTWLKLSELSRRMPSLLALRLSRNFGKELALCAGLENASGDAIIVMDGDLQHPPEMIGEMVRLWQNEGYDLVECVKEFRGEESVGKKLGASLFYATLNRLTGFNLKDASDYKLLDRRVVDAWMAMPERMPFFRGMTAWLGFRKTQISFRVAPREEGPSRWSPFGLFRLAAEAIVSFSTVPLRVVSLMGIIFMLISVVLGIQTLMRKLMGDAVTGFTTVILLLLIIGSVLMLSIGVVGEYIAAIYHEVKARPRYLIADKRANADRLWVDREFNQHDQTFISKVSNH